MEKLGEYVKPFSSDTGALWRDGQTKDVNNCYIITNIGFLVSENMTRVSLRHNKAAKPEAL